jgi:hypothetical protein
VPSVRHLPQDRLPMATRQAPEQALLSVDEVIREALLFLRHEVQSHGLMVTHHFNPATESARGSHATSAVVRQQWIQHAESGERPPPEFCRLVRQGSIAANGNTNAEGGFCDEENDPRFAGDSDSGNQRGARYGDGRLDLVPGREPAGSSALISATVI